MLCAQHAINNLLQAPYLTVDALGQIARSLDEAEAANLDPDAAAALHKDSPNYDDTGFFSLAVIEQALQAFSLSLVRWQSPEMAQARTHPEQLEGFILNHDVHWYTLRKFANNKRWYKIDSCEDSPEWISPTYLGMYLQQAEEQGYSIFVVHPVNGSYGLPDCDATNRALNLPSPSAATPAGSSSRTPLVANHSFGKRAPTPSELSFASDVQRPRKSRRVQQPPPLPLPLDAGEGRSPRSASPTGGTGGAMTEEEELAAAIAASLAASTIDSSGEGSQGGAEEGRGNGNGGGKGRGKGRAEVVTLGSDEDDEISFVPVPRGSSSKSKNKGQGEDSGLARPKSAAGGSNKHLRPLALPKRPSHSAPAASPAPVPTPAPPAHRSRGDLEEEEMLAAALKASLEQAQPGEGKGAIEGGEGKEQEEEEEDYDEPSPEEMRRRRLARFG